MNDKTAIVTFMPKENRLDASKVSFTTVVEDLNKVWEQIARIKDRLEGFSARLYLIEECTPGANMARVVKGLREDIKQAKQDAKDARPGSEDSHCWKG